MAQSKSRVLFLDETQLRLNAVRHRTLLAPGEQKYVVVEDTTAYAARYDMIACISGEGVLPPKIFSPEDRERLGVKGITKDMVNQYIDELLAQAVGALDQFPITLVVDRSTAHNTGEMLQAFHDVGCQDVQTVYSMPTNSAKRLSPLDNTLFHQWKEACRKRGKISKRNIEQVMSDCWNQITKKQIMACYKHCGLICPRDSYQDCPDPLSHQHHLHGNISICTQMGPTELCESNSLKQKAIMFIFFVYTSSRRMLH